MRTEFVNPFLAAAARVLSRELGETPQRGEIRLAGSRVTPGEVTVAVGVTGDVEGTVLYGTSEITARRIVGRILGRDPFLLEDTLVESGAAELGNMITGQASADLERSGYRCDITPPAVLIGRDVLISTVEFRRLVIPLQLEVGRLEIHVALQERGSVRRSQEAGSAEALRVLRSWSSQTPR
ncbi:MAG TPA: chemotaxis protein CheX [Bacillota bacterium]